MQCFNWHKAAFDALAPERGALAHALLIHGPRGVGKLVFANVLAQALLCERHASSGACGTCAACHWFDAGNHPDFRFLEPLGNEGEGEGEGEQAPRKGSTTQIVVEQVRALEDFVNVTSHRGGAKVILIHPAEALNASAANALLKSLEEPPPATYFLLVAHRPSYLPATVRSRCRQVPLARPDSDAAVEWLRTEGVADPALALAHTGNAPLLARDLAQADYWEQRASLLDSIADDGFDPLTTAERIRDYDVERVVGWLQKWSYDVLSQREFGAIRFNPDYRAQIGALAPRVDTLTLMRYHREVVRLQRVVHHPFNARLLFEKLLYDYQSAIAPLDSMAAQAA